MFAHYFNRSHWLTNVYIWYMFCVRVTIAVCVCVFCCVALCWAHNVGNESRAWSYSTQRTYRNQRSFCLAFECIRRGIQLRWSAAQKNWSIYPVLCSDIYIRSWCICAVCECVMCVCLHLVVRYVVLYVIHMFVFAHSSRWRDLVK